MILSVSAPTFLATSLSSVILVLVRESRRARECPAAIRRLLPVPVARGASLRRRRTGTRVQAGQSEIHMRTSA